MIQILINWYKFNGRKDFTIAKIAKYNYVSYSIAKNTMQHLKKRGIVRVKNRGRGRGRGRGRESNIYEITNFGERWLLFKLGFRDSVSRGI